MCRAELFQSVTERIDCLGCCADDHPEEVLLEEAGRGESQAILLRQKLTTELNIVLDVAEFLCVNAHHHVHGCAAPNRSHTSDCAQAAKSSLRRGSELLLHIFKVAIRHFFKNFR